MKEIKILIDLANSPHVILERGEALQLFNCLYNETGGSNDLEESIRIIESFDEFLNILKRKFEDYITPKKDQREVITGKAIVHKLRLFKENNTKLIEIVFDRRFDINFLKKCLNTIGYDNIVIEKYTL